jgi:MFS family permease
MLPERAAMTDVATSASTPWFRAVDRSQWQVLIAANLGWLFDGFETYALILTAGPAMRSLLDPSDFAQIPAYVGAVFAITLLGWGIGGMVGGVLADYIGRKRTMIIAIIAYSLMTGLTAFAFNWLSFAALRFLVGIAIGSEWATGASMVAELWPDRARGKGAGLMQSGLTVGFFIASLLWLFVGQLGPDAWRYMFVIGVLPAAFTLWIRTSIREPDVWQRADGQRRAALARKRNGMVLTEADAALARFTIADLFVEPEIRRRTIIVFAMSLATTLAWWGISTFVPPYVAGVAGRAGLAAQQWATYAALAFNFGALLGQIAFGFLADRFGRKPITLTYFALAFAMTPALFMWTDTPALLLPLATVNSIFCQGLFAWMPVWLPELFPTRLRATALAFSFNMPRFIACLGPLLAGTLIVKFGGYSQTAMLIACVYILGFAVTPLLPETKGKGLPEQV